jgi:hypothetical protein
MNEAQRNKLFSVSEAEACLTDLLAVIYIWRVYARKQNTYGGSAAKPNKMEREKQDIPWHCYRMGAAMGRACLITLELNGAR